MKTRAFAHTIAALLSGILIFSCLLMFCALEVLAADAADSAAETAVHAPQGIPYIEFYADRAGIDPADIDLSRAVCLVHTNWDCEEGFPTERIMDEETIRIAAERISQIYVTSDSDGMFSTAAGHAFSFLDEDDREILGISIQEGMIETADGRYAATGIEELSGIPGVMYPGDWAAYYNNLAEEEEEYIKTHELQYPCSLFEAKGKAAFNFYNTRTVDDVSSIYFFHAGKNKTVTDRDEIAAIYDSICRIQVTGPGKASRWDDSWSFTIFYTNEDNIPSSIQFSFRSGALDCSGERDFTVEGLEGVLESYDWSEFEVIADLI